MNIIKWASKNCCSMFGYNRGDLIGKSINSWIPQSFAQCHDQILKNYYVTGRESLTSHMYHTFSLDKDGFCFSINLFIKVIPINESYEIMALYHKLNQTDYFIVE